MLKAFSTWLASEASLTIGTTLYAGKIPMDAPDLCTAVLERGGEPVHAENAALREKAIQLFTRGPHYFAARDEAFRIFEKVIDKAGVQITGFWIHSITGGTPQYIGQDDRRRVEFSANLLVRHRKEL